ncbi:MAG: ABC transporter substrate-binding protein, partial [Paracoccus sp. (in: a-proteobacteria)]|nr:ABC transporter substrate-binding protein [Paracoccus sp. (in: a-proteobacteria)]
MKQAHALLGSVAAAFMLAAPASAQERLPAIELLTTTQAYDPIRYESAYIVADAWRDLGLEVNVTPLEFSTLLGRFYDQQDFDATIIGWSGRVDRLDPQFFLGTLDGRRAEPGGNNAGGYENPEFDALYDAQSAEFDRDARQQIVHQMQELYMPDAPLAVLFYRDEVVGYNKHNWDNLNAMAGEALYSEWMPMEARPLTERTTLRVGGPQEPDNINPLASTSVWGWKWMRLYYDRLVRLSPEVEPLPWAAETVEAVDPTTIRVVLRDGMTFHDGQPVRPEDVAFTYNLYKSSSYAYFDAYLAPMDRAEVAEDGAVLFHLNAPTASFASISLSQIPILPEHIWGEIENPEDLTPENTPTVGSGPFIHQRFDRGELLALSKNPDHFNADNIAADALEFRVYADAEGVFTALQTGQIDLTAWRME